MTTEKKEMQIGYRDEVLQGFYSNNILIFHTRSEFVLDCMSVFPPRGVMGARVIVSPGHVKRLSKALQENIAKYEKIFGEIPDESAPSPSIN